MEKTIKYVRVCAENTEACKIFETLMYAYIEEISEHTDFSLSQEFLEKWINSIISMQGPADRHLELCYVDEQPMGFLYGKVDHEDHNGYIKPGYGYIMEFYAKPSDRRQGYGRKMFYHLEGLFRTDGAKQMYLTADPVTGKPFWEAMGFRSTGERSPENQQFIYEQSIAPVRFENGCLSPLTQEIAEFMRNWEYPPPYEAYNFKGLPDDWLMDETTWGTEQFCLMDGDSILGQVACQLDGSDLWVGWSMVPSLCGQGNGSQFVRRCVMELLTFTSHTGRVLLRVAAQNRRAIRAYEKAGFSYVKTIQDEIAYSNHMEDFWIMELDRTQL